MLILFCNTIIMNVIYYPSRPSKFETQSALFTELKKIGYDVRGGVRATKSKLDIVVYDKHRGAICIVDVRARKEIRGATRKYKQISKYEDLFKLPVVVCLNYSQINQTIERVELICLRVK